MMLARFQIGALTLFFLAWVGFEVPALVSLYGIVWNDMDSRLGDHAQGSWFGL